MSFFLFLQRWWRSIDRIVLCTVIFLFSLGCVLSFTYTHALTHKLSIDQGTFFIYRHLFYFITSIILMVVLSGLPERLLTRISFLMAGCMFFLTIATLFYSPTLKGGQRWLRIFGVSVQPSEMLRAIFPFITAYTLAQFTTQKMQIALTAIPMLAAGGILLAQPDIGMVFLILLTYSAQLFVIIKNIWIFVSFISLPAISIMLALIFSAHARARLQTFLEAGATQGGYQVALSTKSFQRGGCLGVGPGEGSIKHHLPDMHSDFIFATIGEELGTLFCLFLLLVYLFIIIRALKGSLATHNTYTVLVSTGCAMYLVGQVCVNTASVLGIIPPKGTTLPFISYGGSSLLSAAWMMGIFLNVSRKHVRIQGQPKH